MVRNCSNSIFISSVLLPRTSQRRIRPSADHVKNCALDVSVGARMEAPSKAPPGAASSTLAGPAAGVSSVPCEMLSTRGACPESVTTRKSAMTAIPVTEEVGRGEVLVGDGSSLTGDFGLSRDDVNSEIDMALGWSAWRRICPAVFVSDLISPSFPPNHAYLPSGSTVIQLMPYPAWATLITRWFPSLCSIRHTSPFSVHKMTSSAAMRAAQVKVRSTRPPSRQFLPGNNFGPGLALTDGLFPSTSPRDFEGDDGGRNSSNRHSFT